MRVESRRKLCDMGDDFDFPIVNFPFICSNIPVSAAYVVYLPFDMIFQIMSFPSGIP
jgi:hypothetical protein